MAYDGLVTLREQVQQRNRRWRLFNEWEAAQPPVNREPAAALADLGTVLSWLEPEVRIQDQDPDKNGVVKMRAALALLRR